jgi:DNA-binding IclR family transcriptional regulator
MWYDPSVCDMDENRSTMSNKPGRRIASVSNALRVLRALAAHPEGVGVTQLAQLIGVGKSSAHLLLVTLADQNFVVQSPDGRYELGLAAFEVGAAAGGVASPGGPLTPGLRELADKSGEAVSLAAASGADAIIVQRIESASVLRAEIRVGTRMPLHSSASGKFLLSAMPRQRVDRIYPSETLPQVTERSIRTKSALYAQLDEIRSLGYAWNEDEYTEGITGVATGVTDATGSVVFALSVAGPTHRFRPDDWIAETLRTADRMSHILRSFAAVTVAPEDRLGEGSPTPEKVGSA